MRDLSTISDVGIVTRTLLGESRGEGKQGMQAVANVIANRVRHPCWWGHDFRSVCLDPYQFSCWLPNDPNRDKIVNWPESDPIYTLAEDIAKQAMAAELEDITHAADSYFAIGTPIPKWAVGKLPCASIGHHIFYKI